MRKNQKKEIKMSIWCGTCGQKMEDMEIHHHIPDIYMNVWNGQYKLIRTRHIKETTNSESLPFTIPPKWADWVLETCGGSINRSGIYRLPGRLWEWCIAKMRNEEDVARFLEMALNKYLDTIKE
jgi:hypothetical protein